MQKKSFWGIKNHGKRFILCRRYNKIYLDNASTTQTDQRVIETMLPYFNENYGNASSLHQFGTTAKDQIQTARKQIADYIKCNVDELIFTASGTEANNFALKGIAFANQTKGNHIIVSSIEHDCILNTCKWLEKQGFVISLSSGRCTRSYKTQIR